MLEQIVKMATEQLGEQLLGDPSVPTNEFDYQGAAQTAGSSIFGTIAEQLGGGDGSALLEMLNGSITSSNNPLVDMMSSNVVESLSNKNGLSPQIAKMIAAVAIPFILNMFNNQASSAQSNGVDIGDILAGALSGNNNSTGGGGGLLGGLLGSVLGGGRSTQSNTGADILSSVLSQVLK